MPCHDLSHSDEPIGFPVEEASMSIFIEHCPVPLETIPVLVTEEDGSQRMALLGEFLECQVVE